MILKDAHLLQRLVHILGRYLGQMLLQVINLEFQTEVLLLEFINHLEVK